MAAGLARPDTDALLVNPARAVGGEGGISKGDGMALRDVFGEARGEDDACIRERRFESGLAAAGSTVLWRMDELLALVCSVSACAPVTGPSGPEMEVWALCCCGTAAKGENQFSVEPFALDVDDCFPNAPKSTSNRSPLSSIIVVVCAQGFEF